MSDASGGKTVGRPEFEVKPEHRERVEQMIAVGRPKAEIAAAIGCSVPTLNKYFADEILNGPARKYAENLGWMFEAARGGNASSMKSLEDIILLATFDRVVQNDEKPSDDRSQREVRLGKKDQADEDAKTAGGGTEWGNDLAPPPRQLQ